MDTYQDEQENEQNKPEPARRAAIKGNVVNSNLVVGDHNTIINRAAVRSAEQRSAEKNRRAMLEVVQNT